MADRPVEFDLIERLRDAGAARDDVLLGIGDDGALLRPPTGEALVLAADTLVDGVHFPAGTSAADVGWKALAVNLSDLAAMGARPAWALVCLTLPEADADWVTGFAEGFGELARVHEVALVGGDTTRGPLSVTVQVAGFIDASRALTRTGARAGDDLWISGTPGDAGAALAALSGDLAAGDHLGALRQRLDRPMPRVALGSALAGIASACIDVSDGLRADLGHLLAGGSLGARLEVAGMPASKALREVAPDAAKRFGFQDAGDDYELLFTAPPADRDAIAAAAAGSNTEVARIGDLAGGAGVTLTLDGAPFEPGDAGWRHFGEGD